MLQRGKVSISCNNMSSNCDDALCVYTVHETGVRKNVISHYTSLLWMSICSGYRPTARECTIVYSVGTCHWSVNWMWLNLSSNYCIKRRACDTPRFNTQAHDIRSPVWSLKWLPRPADVLSCATCAAATLTRCMRCLLYTSDAADE